ncbi:MULTISPECIES: peptidoglycan D,D-transpeptidase FtsI family protein [Prochlorococcus]|uniref:Cell division protein FtsI (Peptidoglycan synthetase) n=1 Tax=Prochlorococcus marinus str. MIT 9116 TaxID=167544 RepID=A0A0A1ZTA5_PROMR|nr:penicillin-binding protein 2 [Prochlorococcus marinus]KGF91015.1 Cell division protein FtsI (Peptidoglycan synthetase) [Prochlorococcus marinus str. MIT 9107]KGF91474.1 Cell division protein FtsI (Peptidoglycan synthetase) [Prochlorococcus marinus str. MIT 9116]KGF93288.1 Cell division protein FtsI (Peptidoglycan synthetase) [Prochlorococcus marinus str. MIT 9123]
MKKYKKIVRIAPLDQRRFKLLYIFSLIIIFSLFGRLVKLQVFNASNLQRKARLIQSSKTESLKKRRSIVDRNKRLIAYDKPLYKLWAHPKHFNFPGDSIKKVRSIKEVVKKLSPILDIRDEILLEKFNNNMRGIKLLDKISEEKAQKIKNLQISGLDLFKYSQRYYPQGKIYSNLVGFVNDENKGSAGLELHLENRIKVLNKSNFIKRGGDGTPLPDNSAPGDFISDYKSLGLTIDSKLQKASFNALSKQVNQWRAKKGFAIVMDVNNGQIISLVTVPSYDPNKFWQYDSELFKGWYSQDLFEPGSTFKPINLALALEEKVIQKDGLVEDIGKINVGGWTLSNWDEKGHGYIDYPKVLQVSSNVAMVKIMQNLDPTIYWDWLKNLGVNKNLETDLYESTAGQLKSKDLFVNQPIEPAVASFGKGFSISPLKLVQLHAAIANGGFEVTPHVTSTFKERVNKNSKKQFFSYEVSQTVLEWMESVVDDGSGSGVKIEGYRIAGKTGTSQKALNGSYTSKKVCSFVATLPVNDPKYVVLVVIDEPSKSYAYGSTVAVPVAKEIIESLIVIEKIPPQVKDHKMIVKKP